MEQIGSRFKTPKQTTFNFFQAPESTLKPSYDHHLDQARINYGHFLKRNVLLALVTLQKYFIVRLIQLKIAPINIR